MIEKKTNKKNSNFQTILNQSFSMNLIDLQLRNEILEIFKKKFKIYKKTFLISLKGR